MDDPEEVFEVGSEGTAPLSAPADTEKAKYVGSPDEEEMRGWRPALGQAIPGRANLTLAKRLGEGGFGEVWLAMHNKTRDHRVFKFCYDADRLRSFRREITLFRLLREALGDRPDIAKLHEFHLDKAPFYLESEYSELGDLKAWSESIGGIDKMPLNDRLELVARIGDAVAAAHSVGILHKDLKPSNILMFKGPDGVVRPRLADFGIGILTDRSQLDKVKITAAGFTLSQITDNRSSRTGTRLYAPPEMDLGKPFSAQGDVYALGVMLYQVIVGDFDQPLGTGWEQRVDDPLLREGIAAATMAEPGKRLPTAAALVAWIRSVEQERDRRRAAAEAAARAEEAVRRERRLRQLRVVGVGLAALVLVLSGLAAFALVQRAEANRQAGIAQRRAEAEAQARALAVEKTKEAEAERSTAVAARRTVEYNAYVGNVEMAAAWLDLRQWDRLRQRLDACPPALRGWEWGWLNASADTSVAELKGQTDRLSSAAFSPDGTRIVTASRDNTARVWDGATGATVAELKGQTDRLSSAAFSPDGRRIVTASLDNTARVWDASTGASVAELKGHTNRVFSAAFSPDGTRIVTASEDNTARVWDAATGAFLVELKGHAEAVYSAAFSPDGGRIVTASGDGVARVWDAVRGVFLAELKGHTDWVASAAFSPDGTRIVTASFDKTARVWDSVPSRVRYAERRANGRGQDGAAIVRAWLEAVKAGTEKDFKAPLD